MQHKRNLFYKGHLIRATLLTSLDGACDLGPSLVLLGPLQSTTLKLNLTLFPFS